MNEKTIIPFSEKGELAITRKPREKRKYCDSDCRRIEIDKEKRRIECKECHQEVDAFDYLMSWAEKGDRRMSALRDLDVELKLKQHEVAMIERELKRLRGQLDRIDRPAKQRIRQAVFDMKYNQFHPTVLSPVAGKKSNHGVA